MAPSRLANSLFTPWQYSQRRRRPSLCSLYTCHIQTLCPGSTLHLFCFRYTLQLGRAVSSFLLLRLPQVRRCHLLTEGVKAWMLRIFLVSSTTRRIINFVLGFFLSVAILSVTRALITAKIWEVEHITGHLCDLFFTKHFIATWSKMPTPLTLCFPNFFSRGPLLASKNNHGSSHSRSRKYRVSRWQVSKIRYLYLRTNIR